MGPEPASSGGGNRNVLIGIAVVLVLIVAAITAVVVTSGGDDEKASDHDEAAEEVFLEPVEYAEDPFTPSVGDGQEDVATTTTALASTTAPPTTEGSSAAVQTQSGGTPGLYGGTRDQASCDKEQLVTYLEDNPSKGKAWADTLGIDQEDIRTYVDTLTPIILRTDTRVTNHGYKNGRATSIQVVLQAGTAVLIDQYGKPVTKCACGNPLTDPVASKARYTGTKWTNFDPQTITVVVETTVVIETYILIDVDSGEPFDRPGGTDGVDDTDFTGLPTDEEPEPPPEEPEQPEQPEQPEITNELLSGTYQLTSTVTGGGSDCTPYAGPITVEVTGEQGARTITFSSDSGSVTGTLAEDLHFATSGAAGGTESFEGRLTVDGTTVTIEGNDTISDGTTSCTFAISGSKG